MESESSDPLDFLSELNYSDLDDFSMGSSHKRLHFPLNNISNSSDFLKISSINLALDLLHLENIKFKPKQSVVSSSCPICFRLFKTGILGEKTNFWLFHIFFFFLKNIYSVICCKNCCFECSSNIVKKMDKTLGPGCDLCIFGLIFPINV